jgi:hypothetical protein
MADANVFRVFLRQRSIRGNEGIATRQKISQDHRILFAL